MSVIEHDRLSNITELDNGRYMSNKKRAPEFIPFFRVESVLLIFIVFFVLSCCVYLRSEIHIKTMFVFTSSCFRRSHVLLTLVLFVCI
jgi:hypothetical protein